MKSAEQIIQEIQGRIAQASRHSRHCKATPLLVGASKGQGVETLERFLAAGLRRFGENYVREALAKWPELKAKYPDMRLHCIGALQSNKAREAVALFEVIETLDREKIAAAIAKASLEQEKSPCCLIQVNIGEESGKAGAPPARLPEFFAYCREDLRLPIAGLMCIPPVGSPPAPYFALMKTWADRLWAGLPPEAPPPVLSMGMSADFEEAIRFGGTEVRIGTALFGARRK